METLKEECKVFDYYEIRISPQWRRIAEGKEVLTKAIKNFTVNMKLGEDASTYRKIRQQVHGEPTWNQMIEKIQAHKILLKVKG